MNKEDLRIFKEVQTKFPDSKLTITSATREDIEKLKQAKIKGVWRDGRKSNK